MIAARKRRLIPVDQRGRECQIPRAGPENRTTHTHDFRPVTAARTGSAEFGTDPGHGRSPDAKRACIRNRTIIRYRICEHMQ